MMKRLNLVVLFPLFPLLALAQFDPQDTPGFETIIYPTTAGSVAANNILEASTDVDWFRFSLNSGMRYLFYSVSEIGDPYAELYYATEKATASSTATVTQATYSTQWYHHTGAAERYVEDWDGRNGIDFWLDFVPEYFGDYYVRVAAQGGDISGATYDFHAVNVGPAGGGTFIDGRSYAFTIEHPVAASAPVYIDSSTSPSLVIPGTAEIKYVTSVTVDGDTIYGGTVESISFYGDVINATDIDAATITGDTIIGGDIYGGNIYIGDATSPLIPDDDWMFVGAGGHILKSTDAIDSVSVSASVETRHATGIVINPDSSFLAGAGDNPLPKLILHSDSGGVWGLSLQDETGTRHALNITTGYNAGDVNMIRFGTWLNNVFKDNFRIETDESGKGEVISSVNIRIVTGTGDAAGALIVQQGHAYIDAGDLYVEGIVDASSEIWADFIAIVDQDPKSGMAIGNRGSVGWTDDASVSLEGASIEAHSLYVVDENGQTWVFRGAIAPATGEDVVLPPYVWQLSGGIGKATVPTSASGPFAVDVKVFYVDPNTNRVGVLSSTPERSLRVAGSFQPDSFFFTPSGYNSGDMLMITAGGEVVAGTVPYAVQIYVTSTGAASYSHTNEVYGVYLNRQRLYEDVDYSLSADRKTVTFIGIAPQAGMELLFDCYSPMMSAAGGIGYWMKTGSTLSATSTVDTIEVTQTVRVTSPGKGDFDAIRLREDSPSVGWNVVAGDTDGNLAFASPTPTPTVTPTPTPSPTQRIYRDIRVAGGVVSAASPVDWVAFSGVGGITLSSSDSHHIAWSPPATPTPEPFLSEATTFEVTAKAVSGGAIFWVVADSSPSFLGFNYRTQVGLGDATSEWSSWNEFSSNKVVYLLDRQERSVYSPSANIALQAKVANRVGDWSSVAGINIEAAAGSPIETGTEECTGPTSSISTNEKIISGRWNLYKNGVLLQETTDYTVDGDDLGVALDPPAIAGDMLVWDHLNVPELDYQHRRTTTWLPDGTTLLFSVWRDYADDSLIVFLNGVRQLDGEDLLEAGDSRNFSFYTAPYRNDQLLTTYYSAGLSAVYAFGSDNAPTETPTGLLDTFSVDDFYENLQVWRNGLFQSFSATYSEEEDLQEQIDNRTYVFLVPPEAGDIIQHRYFKADAGRVNTARQYVLRVGDTMYGDLDAATSTISAATIEGANVTSGVDPGHTHTGASLSSIDHGGLLGLTDDDHTQYGALAQNEIIAGNWVNTANPWADNEVADDISLTDITQITNRSHTNLTNVGTNTHTQIDTHIASIGDLGYLNSAPANKVEAASTVHTHSASEVTSGTFATDALYSFKNDLDVAGSVDAQGRVRSSNGVDVISSSGCQAIRFWNMPGGFSQNWMYGGLTVVKDATVQDNLTVEDQLYFSALEGDKIFLFDGAGAADYKLAISANDLDYYSDYYHKWHSDTNTDAMILDANTGNLTVEGDFSGGNVTSGADPGHTHTGASISGIDISDDTNLAVSSPLSLNNDTVQLSSLAASIVTAATFSSNAIYGFPLDLNIGDDLVVQDDIIARDIISIDSFSTAGYLRLGANDTNHQFSTASSGAGSTTFYVGDAKLWTAATDGTGSGLDADLLDGNEGAYYLDNTDTQILGVSGNEITLTNSSNITAPFATTAGGAPPTGAAGGDLGGTYPNPTVDNSTYFITTAGSSGQVWKSDGVGSGAWGTDNDTTANETITLSGDVTGSGATAITTTIGSSAVDPSMLNSANSPVSEWILTYQQSTSQFQWEGASSLFTAGEHCTWSETDVIDVDDDWYNSLADLQSAVSNDFHNLGGTDDDVPDANEVVVAALNIGNAEVDEYVLTYEADDGKFYWEADETGAGAGTDYHLSSASFNTADGVLSLVQAGTTTVTADLDGRYNEKGDYQSIYFGTSNPGNGCGSGRAYFWVDTYDNPNMYLMATDNSGTNYEFGPQDTTTFTGLHSYFLGSKDLSPGELVSLRRGRIWRTNQAKDPSAIGLYQGIERNRDSMYQIRRDEKAYAVACLGDSMHRRRDSPTLAGAWVTISNGVIFEGDYLCSSNRPGWLMRQDDDLKHNYTVGIARERIVEDTQGAYIYLK